MPSLRQDQPRRRRHRAHGSRPSNMSMAAVAALVIALFSGAALAWSLDSPGQGAQSSSTRQRTDATAGLAVTGSGSASSTAASTSTASTSASARGPATAGGAAGATTTLAVGALTTGKLSLGASYSYMQAGCNEVPRWKHVDTSAAPDGTAQVAWQASDGIHVTPLTSAGVRTGSDVVVSGAQEVGGLVALNDGFALLT